ncbi:Do family serine endopeptidase [candidate division KSB1 bacterium]
MKQIRVYNNIMVMCVTVLLLMTYTVSSAAQQGEIDYAKSLSKAFTRVAQQVTPAVVSIEAERTVSTQEQFRFRGLEDFFRDRQMPEEYQSTGLGSGSIIDPEGYILTNNHVVEDAENITVRLNDKRQFEAKLVGRDPQTDVALLKIDGEGLPYAKLGDSNNIQVGEWVVAVGTPFGEVLVSTVTAGIISAVGRNLDIIDDRYRIENFIQTDAAINPGNSGGPLVNLDGEIIGMNTAIVSSTGRYQGYGFAVPINLAKNIAADLRKYGKAVRGILGVQIRDIGDKRIDNQGSRLPLGEDMEDLKVSSSEGVVIEGFSFEDSPAEKAGLQPNDVVIKVDDIPIKRSNELQTLVSGKDPDDRVKLTIMRDGKQQDIWVTLGSIPEEEEGVPVIASVNVPELGIEVQNVAQETEQRLFGTSQSPHGVQVTRVLRGYEAENKGIEIGDIIYQIERTQINSVTDFRDALERYRDRDQVVFRIRNEKGRHLISVNLGR